MDYYKNLDKSNKFIKSEISKGHTDIGISLNGGKDSIVVFNLFIKNLIDNNKDYSSIPCIFCKESNCFDEVLEIVNNLKNKYNLKLEIYEKDIVDYEFMKNSLKNFIKKYKIKRMILGTRQTDPNLTNLSMKEETNNNWPYFIRLMPVYYWSYKNIWKYIDFNKLIYPSLYKKGYTYLGNKFDTIPNPFLLNNQHARNGSDNIEIFSRKKYFKQILNKKLNYLDGVIWNPLNKKLVNLDFKDKKYSYLKNKLKFMKIYNNINTEKYLIEKRKTENSINKVFFIVYISYNKLKVLF